MQYGLIGEKLPHSYSAAVHAMFADYEYILKEISPDSLDKFMRVGDFRGINVTIPYKQAVMPYLNFIDEKARSIGAVNTIVNEDGVLKGYNTDFYGMKALFDAVVTDLSDKTVLILGSGGTSKTARAVAKSLNAKEVVTVSRGASEGTVDYVTAYQKYASEPVVIVNTTPVGMFPKEDASPVDVKQFSHAAAVVDAIYNPLRTNLLLQAQANGVPNIGGLYMLVMQAAKACELFTGMSISNEAVSRAYKEMLSKTENIFLIGMPGCGKSTVGKRVAQLTDKEFIDLDEAVVKDADKPITDIFAEGGEKLFRKIESRVLCDISHSARGAIIATGGGAVLKKENVRAMKRSGRLVFIDRDISLITPTDDRPLSNDRTALEKRYKERYPIYSSVCDVKIDSRPTVDETAMEILKELGKTK